MNFFLKRIKLFLFFIFIVQLATSQEIWDWQKCIDYALQHNLQMQQADLNIQLGETNLKANRMGYSPSIQATSNYNLNIGNNYNFFTTNYEKQVVHSQDYGINLSQPIFDGLYTSNSVKKSKYDLQALKLDQDVLKNNIQLQIITAFLNIMNANEQHQQASIQYGITQEQLELSHQMIKSGAAAEMVLLDIEAQLSNEQLTIAQIKNQLELAKLQLKMLLQLEPKTNFEVKIPELPTDFKIETLEDVQQIYTSALTLRPEIKSMQLKSNSANQQIKVARSAYFPTLNFLGNLNTFFTTQNKNTTQIFTGNNTAIGMVEGTFQRVLIPETKTVQTKINYSTQLNQNLSYAFGLSLNVPIFNKYQTQTAVKQAKLQAKNAHLQEKQTALDLYNSIQQAYLKAHAAIDNYNTSALNYSNAQKSYQYAEQRFNLGTVNQLQLNMAKSNLDNAISKLTQAKYEYLFNTKLLDFYQGKKIEL